MLTGDPERDGDETDVALLREYWADVPASAEGAVRELLGWWNAHCLRVRADRVGEDDHPPTHLVPQRVARRAQPIGQGQYPTPPRSTDAHRGRLPAESWESAAKHGRRSGNRYSQSSIATGVAAGKTSCHAAPRQRGVGSRDNVVPARLIPQRLAARSTPAASVRRDR